MEKRGKEMKEKSKKDKARFGACIALIVIGIVGGFIVIATYGSMFSMYNSM